ncbi:Caleosin [Klebsormidium nitens]|uniref:Caleosin n=1 Tax=Klebsormidium nitens TaxID=105231 RepID=A0A1Y1INH0_KLENI|nr:Caleosin [Klebsormidium nitens]|eukprot:GAQ91652.1 Caleosin [Klebsormidium nitens]
MLGFSRHDVKVAALAIVMMLVMPGLQPTPRVPDTSYRANPSTLQQHVEYFDRNRDGVISLPETFESLNRLGFNWWGNFYRAPFINWGLTMGLYVKGFPPLSLSSLISPAFWNHLLSFDFQLRVPIQTIHQTIHPSDSGVYDKNGQFNEAKFERLMSFDKAGKGGINRCEMTRFIKANNNPPDVPGNIGSKFEWFNVFEILHDDKGVMSREKLLKMYNGSVFEEIERAVAAKKGIQTVRTSAMKNDA